MARVHSGDPSLYGAVLEQIELCEEIGLDWRDRARRLVPGRRRRGHRARAHGAGGLPVRHPHAPREPHPDAEQRGHKGASPATGRRWRSSSPPRSRALCRRTCSTGGYAPETPCAVVYRASWPDEEVIECRSGGARATASGRPGFTRQALILVGPGLGAGGTRSHLYQPGLLAHVPQGRARRPEDPRCPRAGSRSPPCPRAWRGSKSEKLRTGWTTGACAAAAAKAAARALVSGEPQTRVDVKLPKKGDERRVEFPVERCELGERPGPRPSSSRTPATTRT